MSVITALEQELGTELDLVLTQLRHVMEGNYYSVSTSLHNLKEFRV